MSDLLDRIEDNFRDARALADVLRLVDADANGVIDERTVIQVADLLTRKLDQLHADVDSMRRPA